MNTLMFLFGLAVGSLLPILAHFTEFLKIKMDNTNDEN